MNPAPPLRRLTPARFPITAIMKPSFLRLPCRFVALLPALAAGGLHAATLAWDASGANPAAPTGGSGTWSTSNLNWSNTVGDVGWTNANNDSASFTAGAGGTITLGENITVNNITFGGSGAYNVTGGSNILTVNGTITVTRSNSITATLAGANGLTKAGTATLGLLSANTYAGDTVIQSGTLQPRIANALPAATRVIVGSASVNATATLDVRTSQTVAGIGNAGTGTSTITNSQTTGVTRLTINPDGAGAAAADSTFSGIIKDGSGTMFLGLTKAGGRTLTLTGTNSYSGSTVVSGGTLKLGSSLTATTDVSVSGGTLSGNDSAANIALGAGAVSMSAGAISAGGAGTAGSFTIAADKNFATTGGTLNFDLGSSFDQIIGSGTGTFGLANTTLALSLGSGFAYTSTYALFSGFAGGSVSGLTITGYDSAGWVAGLSSSGVLSFASAAIPEPSACALLAGAAMLATGIVLRRRRST